MAPLPTQRREISCARTDPAALYRRRHFRLDVAVDTQLNEGLAGVIDTLASDPVTSEVVRLGILGFSDEVNEIARLADPRQMTTPAPLEAGGATYYRPIFLKLAQVVQEDEQLLHRSGFATHPPMVFFLTDGVPVDTEWHEALELLQSAPGRPKIFSFGVDDADPSVLAQIATNGGRAIHADWNTSFADALSRFLEVLVQSTVDVVTIVPRAMGLTEDQRLIGALLSEKRLRDPSDDLSRLPSNREIAHRLGWTQTKFNRKLDGMASKFAALGIQGLVGGPAGPVPNRRARLVEHLVDSGLVDLSDLESVPDPD